MDKKLCKSELYKKGFLQLHEVKFVLAQLPNLNKIEIIHVNRYQNSLNLHKATNCQTLLESICEYEEMGHIPHGDIEVDLQDRTNRLVCAEDGKYWVEKL